LILIFRAKLLFSVQHVLMKPEVKGLDGEVAGPPPQEPRYFVLPFLYLKVE
jgi:hypothetical protein